MRPQTFEEAKCPSVILPYAIAKAKLAQAFANYYNHKAAVRDLQLELDDLHQRLSAAMGACNMTEIRSEERREAIEKYKAVEQEKHRVAHDPRWSDKLADDLLSKIEEAEDALSWAEQG